MSIPGFKTIKQIGLSRQAAGLRQVYLGLLARKSGMKLISSPLYLGVRQAAREIRVSRIHDLYLRDMIQFFDYYHAAVEPVVIGDIAVVDYSQPKVHRLLRSGIEFEFPSLPESDESTEVYLEMLQLKSGDVVFDLGAYAGASAYFLSQKVGPAGLVAAFEPDEVNHRSLEKNVARHQLTNVRLFKQGVWEKSTTLAFQAESNMGSSVAAILGRNSNVKTVEVVSLDDAVRLCGIERVAAIKMDIEGAELPVLKAAGEFLRFHRPSLIIEPHVIDGKLNAEELTHLLRSYGYTVKTVLQGTQNWPLLAARYGS